MVLGGLFILELLGIVYLVIADPFHVRPLMQVLWQSEKTQSAPIPTSVDTPSSAPTSVKTGTAPAAVSPAVSATPVSAPAMTAAQTKALQSVGIDPNTITPAQLSCFTSILGVTRVAEIKAGAMPTSGEFFSVRSCL